MGSFDAGLGSSFLASHVHPDDLDPLYGELLPAWREEDRKVIDEGVASFVAEEPFRDAAGGLRFLQTTKVPLVLEDGVTRAALGVGIDVTERKRADDELKTYRDHLEDLVKERTAELAVAKEKAEESDRLKSAAEEFFFYLRIPLRKISWMFVINSSTPSGLV